VYRSGNGYQGVVILREVLTDTVTFDANSGSGTMAEQTDSLSAALSANAFTRPGYTFRGWNSSMNGSGTPYADGATYDFSADVWLYAQWTPIPQPRAVESESAGNPLVAQNAPPVPAAQRAGTGTDTDQLIKNAPVTIERAGRSLGPGMAAKAMALVAGEEVTVSAQPQGTRRALYGVGEFSLEISLAEGQGFINEENGDLSVQVARDSPAGFSARGLMPNSTMQVFLPASDGSFIALPDIKVNSEGTREGSLTLGNSPRGKPLPIGARFLQIVSLDANGIETVLDIPVVIAQPMPSPEKNLMIGERPVLRPGQAMATNGGTPETVTVRKTAESREVIGDTWSFGVEATAIVGAVESLALARDEPIDVQGSGFMPGTRADVWLFSDPILLGTVDIGDDGTFSAKFAVDSNFVPTGNHTLQIQGVAEDGIVRAANLGVVVEDRVSTPIIPTDADPVGWVPLMFIGTSLGGLFVLVGVTMAVRGRQRSRDRFVPVSP
jgi:uncharacterized repeat protein (TIGR02543 family)